MRYSLARHTSDQIYGSRSIKNGEFNILQDPTVIYKHVIYYLVSSTNKTLVLDGKDVTLSASRLELIVKQDKQIKKYLPSNFDYDMVFSTAMTGYVSIKALNWLSSRKAGLLFYQVNGEPIYTAIPNYPDRDPHIQIKQFRAFMDEKIRSKIAEKILKAKYEKANKLLFKLGYEPISTKYEEQTFSRLYWLKLREQIRKYGYEYDTRKGVNKVLNRHATSIINATLNLFYGYVESKILLEIAKQGLNPYISFLHKPTFQKSSLAYDIVEYVRSDIDDIVLDMFKNNKIKQDMFYIVENSYYLVKNPHIAISKLEHLDITHILDDIMTTFDDI